MDTKARKRAIRKRNKRLARENARGAGKVNRKQRKQSQANGRGSSKKKVVVIILVALIALSAVFVIPKLWHALSDTNKTTVEQKNGAVQSPAASTASTSSSNGAAQSNTISYISSRYYLSKLSAEELKAAEAIYQGVSQFEESTTVTLSLSKDQMEKVSDVIHLECPELMQLDRISYVYEQDGTITELKYTYSMNKDEYEKKRAAVESELQVLKTAENGKSDYEAALSVYDSIALSVTYNKTADDCENAYGALVKKSAKCDGISAAFQWALNYLGIGCSTVSGSSVDNNEPHAWNMVKMDGSWYFTDLTADSRTSGTPSVTMHPAHLVSRAWMDNAYSMDELFATTLGCPVSQNDMDKSYHVKNGSFLNKDDSFEKMLEKTLQKNADESSYAVIQFTTDSALQDAMAEIQTAVSNVYEGQSSYQVRTITSENYRTLYIEIAAAG